MSFVYGNESFDLRHANPIAKGPFNRVFWHGTDRRNVDSILTDGLIPEKTNIGHTCLSTCPAIALFFGRLAQSFGDGDGPVLIRVDGGLLDQGAFCPERGCIECGPYGKDLPGRDRASLTHIQQDTVSLMKKTECVGYTRVIFVREGMIDWRAADLPRQSQDQTMKEYKLGRPVEKEVQTFLRELQARESVSLCHAA